MKKWLVLKNLGPNAGEPSHCWLGSKFGRKALKGRSAGGWRSGRRRSEVRWRRGYGLTLRQCSVRAGYL